MRAFRWQLPNSVRRRRIEASFVALSPLAIFCVSMLAVLGLAGRAAAQAPQAAPEPGPQAGPQWRLNLDDAEKLAMQTNRLVLIHFWAPWCGPCRALENNVFAQPGVGAALESRFVPVKINLDDHAYSATSRLYGIQSIPTDVVITPSGRLLARIPCSQDPRLYVSQLMRTAGDAPPMAVAAAAPPPSYSPPAYSPPAYSLPPSVPASAPTTASDYPPQPSPGGNTAGLSMYSPSNLAAYSNRPGALPGPAEASPPAYSPPPAAPAATASYTAVSPTPSPAASSTAMVPSAAAPAAGVVEASATPGLPARPPLGLDGYCPVTLIERHHDTPNDPHCWVQGNPRWGVIHRGTVYLFVGPEEQHRFLADPDRYSPALSGNDPVVAFDQARLVQGTRQFGIFLGDRIFLFSSAESLAKFAQTPDMTKRYAEEVRQAEANSHASLH